VTGKKTEDDLITKEYPISWTEVKTYDELDILMYDTKFALFTSWW
jgi:hypothetical protein